ncbi:hypothetical protein ACFS5N_00835 [Mucilaginibacter ximonensis]|uniref:Lipocalin-like domain-containing protein n=1 Tax=Mucilaginibacter ximonensis TaxID=538021 RepID=A0ABW5Y6K4_9SPHI
MRKLFFLLAITSGFAACKPSATSEKLYGKWNYIRVRNPLADPPDSVGKQTLASEKPYIEFTKQDSLIINWDGKVLSHGTFKLDGLDIKYKEILGDGQTRDFPFHIEDFSDKQLIFSTAGKDGSEVTAVKE